MNSHPIALYTTRQLNLRLKFQKQKRHFWIQTFLKVKDSEAIQFLMCVRTSNLHETFKYTHFSSCHPPGVKKGFIKGQALRLLRTNDFVTQYHPAVPNLKQILLKDWHLIEQQPLLKEINKDSPNILQKRAINQRYTRESQIIRKAKTHTGNRAGLSLLYTENVSISPPTAFSLTFCSVCFASLILIPLRLFHLVKV